MLGPGARCEFLRVYRDFRRAFRCLRRKIAQSLRAGAPGEYNDRDGIINRGKPLSGRGNFRGEKKKEKKTTENQKNTNSSSASRGVSRVFRRKRGSFSAGRR